MDELMTVRMAIPTVPSPTGNLDDVQANITALLESYTGRVYTPEEIKSAKADRAQVNKWDKQLLEASQTIKQHYLAAIEKPLDQIAAMRGQVKEVSSAIDRQVKAVEEAERADKRNALEAIYRDAGPDICLMIPFDQILDRKWLNKTTSAETASRELRKIVAQHRSCLNIIRESCDPDVETCIATYIETLSLNESLNEHKRRETTRKAAKQADAVMRAEMALRDASPVGLAPSLEEREIRSEAAAAARASALITNDGRLDTALMAEMSHPTPEEEPERRRYRFWVEFTQDDIQWFKAAAAERGFRFGSIK